MGVFDSKAELLACIDGHYSDALSFQTLSITYQGYAYAHYLAADYPACILDMLFAMDYTNRAVGFIAFNSGSPILSSDMTHFLSEFAGGDVTWRAICEAWAVNDFEGRNWTIACIDRMRQLLWDEPFYAVWASNPEKDKE